MKYHSIIIGFGKGGKTLAGDLAKKGEKVALVEKSSKMYGGTCINTGCIPSKSLVKNAKLTEELKGDFAEKQEFFKDSIIEKKELVQMLRQKNYEKLYSLENITIIDGKAEFVDQYKIQVEKENSVEILEGEKIFIITI